MTEIQEKNIKYEELNKYPLQTNANAQEREFTLSYVYMKMQFPFLS